jgi:hypothetical protein
MVSTIRCATWLAALALLAIPAGRAQAQEREPGVLWESTVEMEMQGFSMPPTTSRFCAPKKGLAEPPGSGQDKDRCRVKDFKNDGGRMTWKMVCAEPEAMEGEGEILQTASTYTGKMKMRSSAGEVTMKMRGRLLGGECDAGEQRRQIEAIQRQMKAPPAR